MTITRTGLAAGIPPSLEEIISDALLQLRSESEMIDIIADAGDRLKAYHRLLINTVLMKVLESDAVLLSRFAAERERMNEPQWQQKSIAVRKVYFEFAQACVGFTHDTALLDVGANAERILTKAKAAHPKGIAIIKARRTVLLAIVLVGQLGLNLTEDERIAEAAGVAGINRGTLRTRVRDLRNALNPERDKSKKALFSDAECQIFREYERKYAAMGREFDAKDRIKLLKYAMFGHL
jgi:hypothetical protein